MYLTCNMRAELKSILKAVGRSRKVTRDIIWHQECHDPQESASLLTEWSTACEVGLDLDFHAGNKRMLFMKQKMDLVSRAVRIRESDLAGL